MSYHKENSMDYERYKQEKERNTISFRSTFSRKVEDIIPGFFDNDYTINLYANHGTWLLPKRPKLVTTGLEFIIPDENVGLLIQSNNLSTRNIFVTQKYIPPNVPTRPTILLCNDGYFPRFISEGELIGRLLIIRYSPCSMKEMADEY